MCLFCLLLMSVCEATPATSAPSSQPSFQAPARDGRTFGFGLASAILLVGPFAETRPDTLFGSQLSARFGHALAGGHVVIGGDASAAVGGVRYGSGSMAALVLHATYLPGRLGLSFGGGAAAVSFRWTDQVDRQLDPAYLVMAGLSYALTSLEANGWVAVEWRLAFMNPHRLLGGEETDASSTLGLMLQWW